MNDKNILFWNIEIFSLNDLTQGSARIEVVFMENSYFSIVVTVILTVVVVLVVRQGGDRGPPYIFVTVATQFK